MTLFTQSPAGYLSIMVNLFLFFDRDWVWIKVGCIFIQSLSELVEAVYLHRRSSTGLFKILNYVDCSWTELELFPEEPRNDYLYNTSLRICAISAQKKRWTEHFRHRIQLISDSTPRDLTYIYLSVLLSLFSLSTLDNCSWKVKRFVLTNLLPSAVDFWSERLTYITHFMSSLKKRRI